MYLLELQTARPEPVVGCATHGAKDSADDVIALKARKVLSPNSGESGSGRRRCPTGVLPLAGWIC